MKKIIVSGCNGRMGHYIVDCVKERTDCTVVAGIDVNTTPYGDFPVFADPAQCEVAADVIIDFSHPAVLAKLLAYAVERKIPVVVATTGLSEEQVETIHSASQSIPIFFTANMSLGVNLLVELAKKAASLLSNDFDIEIIEKHHNQKIDAPSGTALMLANEISTVLTEKPQYVYDRHQVRQKREKNEIGIHAVRGGTIVGEHDVIFAGRDEVLTLSHSAASKQVFAVGAINAALFLACKAQGLYSMKDMISF